MQSGLAPYFVCTMKRLTVRHANERRTTKVALKMDNSPAMIFRHYRELIMPQDAAAWWSIFPEEAANVVPMSVHQTAK
jgi:hypothetical protein